MENKKQGHRNLQAPLFFSRTGNSERLRRARKDTATTAMPRRAAFADRDQVRQSVGHHHVQLQANPHASRDWLGDRLANRFAGCPILRQRLSNEGLLRQ